MTWVTAERAFSELFFLGLFAIQAPLLGPAAFGLVASVMIFVGFWEQVPGHAVTEALVSINDIDDLHYSSVTGFSALICLIIGAMVFALANPIAHIFGNTNLTPVVRAMSVLPIIQAFAIAPTAAAQRDMRFQSISLRTILSLLAGGTVGLGLALAGAGVWSLVCQTIVQRFVAVVVLWLAVPVRFNFAISRSHGLQIVAFAVPVMVARSMGWVSSQVPRLILGLHLGPTGLGLFTIASRLSYIVEQVTILPKATVARVDLRRYADHADERGAAVYRVFLQISLLAFPTCIGGAAVAHTLFHAWLDPRWFSAIVPTQLMLLSTIPSVTFYSASALLLALNNPRWEAVAATTQGLGIVLAVALISPFGLAASTAAIAVMQVATAPLPIFTLQRKCGISLANILMPQALAFTAASVMGITVAVLRPRVEAAHSSPVALMILVSLGAALYAIILALMMPRRTARLLRVITGPIELS